jgi:hypothetical protein
MRHHRQMAFARKAVAIVPLVNAGSKRFSVGIFEAQAQSSCGACSAFNVASGRLLAGL